MPGSISTPWRAPDPGAESCKRDVEGRASGQPSAVSRQHIQPPLPVRTAGGPPFDDVPLTQIRKTIAKRLALSIGPIPHFFLTTEVDMERAAEARDALNHQLGDQGKVSFNDIVVKATALTLAKHRRLQRLVAGRSHPLLERRARRESPWRSRTG